MFFWFCIKGKGSHRSTEYSSDSVNELEYDYSLQEDMSGSEDGNGCCLHVPPIPETPEQIHSKVRYHLCSFKCFCELFYQYIPLAANNY